MDSNAVRKHSKRSPSHPLTITLGFLEKVYRAVGTGPFDRETFARALGHETLSGPSSTKIASLVHFGLLKKARDGYEISELAERLLSPTSDAEKKLAIIDAAKRPNLYHQVFERYKSQPLPTLLPNVLHREYGVDRKQANRAAENFRQTAEFAGLLRHGVLHPEPENGRAGMTAATARTLEPAVSASSAETQEDLSVLNESRPVAIPSMIAPEGARSFCIPLNSTATRVAVLQLPVPIEKSDLERVKKWIKFLEEHLKEAPDED